MLTVTIEVEVPYEKAGHYAVSHHLPTDLLDDAAFLVVQSVLDRAELDSHCVRVVHDDGEGHRFTVSKR